MLKLFLYLVICTLILKHHVSGSIRHVKMENMSFFSLGVKMLLASGDGNELLMYHFFRKTHL